MPMKIEIILELALEINNFTRKTYTPELNFNEQLSSP